MKSPKKSAYMLLVAIVASSCAGPPVSAPRGRTPAEAESPALRSDVLYLPDTPAGHQNASRLKDVLHFRQEVVFRDLDPSRLRHLDAIHRVPPTYPSSLLGYRKDGSVTLVFIVDEQGRVAEAAISKSTHPDFEAPALSMIQTWRFQPATYDGVPIRNVVELPVVFSFEQ